MTEFKYAKPRVVGSPSDCFFYHVMDLPGVGRVGEQWDLRETVDAYLGHVDVRGKRVLDVGAASGFLTFEMEKRGASVVSFDSGPDLPWDIAPSGNMARALPKKREERERLVNAYWFAHRALGSRAKAFYGNIYDLPEGLGPFDIVLLGSVLLHVRDPFLALQSAARLCRSTLVVVDFHFGADAPVMEFLPGLEEGVQPDTWWRISEGCMARMVTVLGFETPSITRSEHLGVVGGRENRALLSTFVAQRRTGSR